MGRNGGEGDQMQGKGCKPRCNIQMHSTGANSSLQIQGSLPMDSSARWARIRSWYGGGIRPCCCIYTAKSFKPVYYTCLNDFAEYFVNGIRILTGPLDV